MAYPGIPIPPRGFTDLKSAWDHPLAAPGDKHFCYMIGVCVDFLPITKSRGSDYTMKLTLHDPYWVDGIGMAFQLFVKKESHAPQVTNQGDVIIFHSAGTLYNPRMGKVALSNYSSTWSVLDYDSLRNSTADDFSDVVIHRSDRDGVKAPIPNVEEIKYAKAILELEDSSSWKGLQGQTSLETNNIMAANGGTPSMVRGKERSISSLTIPVDRDYYVDILAEVRRIYTTDMRMELSVTDYTDENPSLFDCKPESDENAHDPGDQFGYIASSHKAWPGPWGRRTFNITLWEPHRSYAVASVTHGSLIQFRNVHVKVDQQAKLEGIVHQDKLYPDKVLVSAHKPYEAETNEPLRDLLKRKKAYEDHCKRSGLRFVRDADPKKLPSHSKLDQANGRAISPQLEEAPRDAKAAKRNKRNKQKQKKKAASAAKNGLDDANERSAGLAEKAVSSLAANAHVRTVTSTQSLISISSILEPSTRQQKTMAGNIWIAPFVNQRYKSKVKVIDFYPNNLEDFAVRAKRKSEYAEAGIDSDDDEENEKADNTPHDHDESSSEDANSDGGNDSDAMAVDNEEGIPSNKKRRSKWEWRFALTITDPNTSPTNASDDKVIRLIVTGDGAEHLLRASACNLRKSPNALAQLREKLFILWGNLEELLTEQLSTSRSRAGSGDVNTDAADQDRDRRSALSLVQKHYKSQPFECFIEEYGVLKAKKTRIRNDGSIGNGDRMEDWERCFRICKTTIA
ncbi:Protection of telomeres protein 1 [Cyphellophora attinorum]|uniref:Protection of telomeres protein 1 n=1 Tax=Cyphellophora attinorum TaxID=1664694 RepID=A0A0N1NXU7_9EURO|nr:Protection of telomeres protein 1 [Phialophora attinorum]KPI36080.1 Protection of telomeres protein 1 [Phialophora attinorum]